MGECSETRLYQIKHSRHAEFIIDNLVIDAVLLDNVFSGHFFLWTAKLLWFSGEKLSDWRSTFSSGRSVKQGKKITNR